MTDTKKRKKGGGRLTRSETVTVRLDPRLRYLSELAARSQRRTLSSYIEWTLQQSLNDILLGDAIAKREMTLAEFSTDIWDVEPVARLLKLAFRGPNLLNFEEQLLMGVIVSTDWFWGSGQDRELSNVKLNRIRRSWDAIESFASHETSQEEFDAVIGSLQESGNG